MDNGKFKLKLSASRYKTWLGCTLRYKYAYIDKLPQKSNLGNRIGDCVHIVLENLAKPKRQPLVDKILSEDSLAPALQISKYIRKYGAKNEFTPEAYEKAEKFILLALNLDFKCKNSLSLEIEKDFDIISEDPPYRIIGYIDQLALYDKNWIRVKDFKSQAKWFEGKDLEQNTQGYIYCLAGKHIHGEDKKTIAEFQMLNFPEDPIFKVKPSSNDLESFKIQLAADYKKISEFGEDNYFDNVAAYNHPRNGEGFVGKLMCGFNHRQGFVKSPDEKKKDGITPKFSCPYRWPFEYYALCNEEGEVLTTSFENDLKCDESKGEFVVKRKHFGCDAFDKKTGLPKRR